MATAMDDSVGLAQPRTLPQLLRMLGVNDKPISGQWHPIMAWLEHNGASRELWMSLLANGYGIHLEQVMPLNRPVPRMTRPPQSCPHGHRLGEVDCWTDRRVGPVDDILQCHRVKAGCSF